MERCMDFFFFFSHFPFLYFVFISTTFSHYGKSVVVLHSKRILHFSLFVISSFYFSSSLSLFRKNVFILHLISFIFSRLVFSFHVQTIFLFPSIIISLFFILSHSLSFSFSSFSFFLILSLPISLSFSFSFSFSVSFYFSLHHL